MKNLKNIIMLFLLAVGGCTTSKITSSWKADNAVPSYYNKILVMGLIRDADRSLQQNMENHIVGDLKELGYNAVSSFKEYGPKAFEGLDEPGQVRSRPGAPMQTCDAAFRDEAISGNADIQAGCLLYIAG